MAEHETLVEREPWHPERTTAGLLRRCLRALKGSTMRRLTLFAAWLIGYYYEPCPVCGRGVAYMNDGRIVHWCDRTKHQEAA